MVWCGVVRCGVVLFGVVLFDFRFLCVDRTPEVQAGSAVSRGLLRLMHIFKSNSGLISLTSLTSSSGQNLFVRVRARIDRLSPLSRLELLHPRAWTTLMRFFWIDDGPPCLYCTFRSPPAAEVQPAAAHAVVTC